MKVLIKCFDLNIFMSIEECKNGRLYVDSGLLLLRVLVLYIQYVRIDTVRTSTHGVGFSGKKEID